MRKKKLLTAVICLALVISMVLPGTLAVSNGQDSSDTPAGTTTSAAAPAPDADKTEGTAADNGETKAEAGSTGNQTPAQNENKTGTTGGETGGAQSSENPENPAQSSVNPENPQNPENPENPAKSSENPENPENPAQTSENPENPEKPENPENPEQQPKEEKECTCGAAEGEAHKADCPLYVAPECTCGAAEGEAHKVGCPLYEAPECTCGAAEGQPHKEDCPLYEVPEAEDYTDLFNRFLAAQTYEEFDAIYQELTEEVRTAFAAWLTENGKMEALQAHLSQLYIVDEPQEEEPIVPFTNVGPLLAAPAVRRRMLRAASNAGDNSGIVLNKTAAVNSDGSYTITLEAYATGETTTTVTQQPVDIVLVLDVSGSMDDPMSSSSYLYQEVYDLNRDEAYYILSNGKYREVTWVERLFEEDAWRTGYLGSPIYPKTSANDTDTSHVQFYSRSLVPSVKKIDALKTAVNGFINSVAAQSPDSKIAIVKFAGNMSNRVGNDTYQDGKYTYNYSQIVKNLTAAGTGADNLKAAVSALRPAGATAADYGMQHAQSIINGVASDGNKKVVIMFTDGEPNHHSGFDTSVANAAISASKSIKDSGATVYTIGVFSGANGAPVSPLSGVSDTNKYMHLVSSNYKNATSMSSTGSSTYPGGGKSYFLSPSNAGELSAIFQSISQEVGGATTTLDGTATIKDIVSPYFTMPADARDVTVKTAESNGSAGSWKDAVAFTGTVSIDAASSAVSVSGFSFKDNWCGKQTDANGNTTFHNGKKLIIQFTVSRKEGFLGGNDVPTNGENSGIYDKNGTEVKKFVVPTVNVPIEQVTVTAEDKNVYLLGTVTAEEIMSGATAKIGKVELTLGAENYGLKTWQTEHVTISVVYKDAAGNTISDIKDLKADTTYTVTVTVTPDIVNPTSTEGEKATEQTDSGTGKINVFMPELTYKDSTAYYGQTVPTGDGFNDNLVSKVWKHNTTEDSSVTMTGQMPKLDITYAPDNTKVHDGKYTKQDVPVAATVKIGTENVNDHTTFVHQDCTTACGWETPKAPGAPAFLIHIKTCTLEIKKTGGAGDESYVFDVYKDGTKYSEVTIEGNGTETLFELPVGNYTIRENTGWSWRYNANNGTEAALSAANPYDSITCTNEKNKDQWLNGFSTVVRNIFGTNH